MAESVLFSSAFNQGVPTPRPFAPAEDPAEPGQRAEALEIANAHRLMWFTGVSRGKPQLPNESPSFPFKCSFG